MRFADLFMLALAALWQQKLRTVLTTLGVAFGGLVLFISLSVGQGVQETIGRELRKHDELRRIGVSLRSDPMVEEVPAAELELKGDLSPDRRERLRNAVVRRWNPGVDYQRRPPITLASLAEMARLEHVTAVRPGVYLSGTALLNGRQEDITATAVDPDDLGLQRKLLAGGMPREGAAPAVLVSEFLLYRCGLTNDADLNAVLGKQIEVEFRGERQTASNLALHVYFQSHPGLSGHDVSKLQEKLRTALPEALARLDLTPAERTMLEALTKPKQAEADLHKEVVLREQFTVAGVFRMPTKKDDRHPWGRGNYFNDLVLPLEKAKQLYLQMPSAHEHGFQYVEVLVDEETNVKQVLPHIEAMGFHCHAVIEFIEREQFLYKLIFASMTCIAGVALLVSGLGITNTMLMSVLERTREIGVMKAVGAAEGHVQLIFLVEGALIGFVGGGLGVFLSWLASIPGDAWIRSMVSSELQVVLEDSLFVFPAWLIVGVLLFCGLVTTLAAVYPARRAGRVNPIAALRHE